MVSSVSAQSIKILDARATGDLNRTRFVVDLDRAIEFAAFTLADPYRIVIDTPQADFTRLDDLGRGGRGLVATFRYGLIAPGKSRLVLDLAGPATIASAYVLNAVDDQPARLVLELQAEKREAFLDSVGRLKSVGTLPEVKPAPIPRRANKSNKFIVVLDPGHGGIDDGAIGSGDVREKSLVLLFAKEVQAALAADDRIDVTMTRDDDTFISLDDRVKFSRELDARLMISFHADTVEQSYVRGATIYTLSEDASDEMAAELAEQENRSDAVAGVELSNQSDEVVDILIDLARRETKNLSISFSNALLDSINANMMINKNPQRAADFKVLKAPDVPSVLVELGYLSNANDEKLLRSSQWRRKAAKQFAKAIRIYVEQALASGG